MNTRQIEIFRAVMQSGTVTEAARQLRVAQPAVSKYIRRLEDIVGLQLFERRNRRLIPTPEAQALFDQIERVYVGLEQVRRFVDDVKTMRHGHLSIACMPLLSQRIMPEALSRFLGRFPDISVSLQTRSSARIVEWVASRAIDIGIGIYPVPYPGVIADPLVDLELYCVVPVGDRLARKKSVEPSDLEGKNIITMSNYDRTVLPVQTLIETYKIKPRRRIETFQISVAYELAAHGLGITLVDGITAHDASARGLCLRPFRPRLSLEIHLLRSAHWPISTSAKLLQDEIRGLLSAYQA